MSDVNLGSPQSSVSEVSESSESHQFNSDAVETTHDERARRARMREEKQAERALLQLTNKFMFEIDQQSTAMIDFMGRFSEAVKNVSHEIEISEVDAFQRELDEKVKYVLDLHAQLIEQNKGDNSEHEKVLNEFQADLRAFKSKLQECIQEEMEMLEDDRALQEAKEEMEKHMKAYRDKRECLRKKIDSSTVTITKIGSPTTSQASGTTSSSPSIKSSTDSEVSNASTEAILKAFTDNLAESFNNKINPSASGKLYKKSVKPNVFSGDELEFADWEVDMDAFVSDEGLTDREALRYLKKFVSGEARKAIIGLLTYQNEDSYQEAREKLRDRYSMDGSVARILLRRLDSWPNIRQGDGRRMREFGDFLDQIRRSMKSTEELRVVDTETYNERICQKLPDNVRFGWTQKVCRAKRQKTGKMTFSDFTEFVLEQADCYMSGLMQSSTKEFKPEYHKGKGKYEDRTNRRATSYHTENSRKEPFCFFCNDRGHYTRDCAALAKKPLKERKEFTQKKGICFACMNGKHKSNVCNRKQTCSTCKRMHPTVLHDPDWKQSERSDTGNAANSERRTTEEKADTKITACNATSVTKGSSFSMMVPVYVSAGNKEKLVYALLDTLSDATFIDKQTAEEIGAAGIPDVLDLETMNAITSSATYRYENLQIRGYLTDTVSSIEAIERPEIRCNPDNIPTDEKCSKIPHLTSIAKHLPPRLDIPIGLMIGKDSPEIITPLLTIRGNAGETTGCKTLFGWTLCGGKLSNKIVSSFMTDAKLFRIEEQDFEDTGGKPMSQQDVQFLQILNKGTSKDTDGNYVLPLPFKSPPMLPNNRHQAEQRLKLLKNKLTKDKAYQADYKKFMDNLMEKGFAEKVPDAELETKNGSCWYIPHFGVLHPKKRKLRVVFDGSARYANTCINDHLLTGPDQLNDLLGILIRFRTGKVAVTCDVESMFYNFRVSPDHKDFLRFLWYSDDLTSIQTFRMKVHIFGATSSPGVATFGLRKLAQDNIDISAEACYFLMENFYVDDGIFSTDDAETAKTLIKAAREMCSKGNLRLHKFVSNVPEVLEELPESEREVEPCSFNEIIPTQRTLGVGWNIQTDQLCFSSNIESKPCTRRGILSTVAQVYDPIGLVAPFTLLGKNILQSICRRKLDWDEPADLETTAAWQNWVSQLDTIHNVSIDRCVKPKDFGEVQRAELHHFSDACENGYGACSYLRLLDTGGNIHCSLVLAKARVAPLHPPTIPRMELQGAVTATSLQRKLNEELQIAIDQVFFWTDSMIVLGYIKNETTKFSPYVTNRTIKIRQQSQPSQWYHVPGSINTADLASRGATIKQILESRWFKGPEFLWQTNLDNMLNNRSDHFQVSSADPEVRKTLKVEKNQINHRIKVENFSDWSKLNRAVTQARLIGKRASSKMNPIWKLVSPTKEDLASTEELLVKQDQEKYFREEIAALQSKQTVGKNSSLKQLFPYLDDTGVLRAESRAKSSTVLTTQELKPAIIHKKSHLAKLLVHHFHNKVHHQGRMFTQSAIRQAGFYIIGAQSLIKAYIRACVGCRRLRGPPLNQLMGQLPKERVEPSPPFTHIGVDTFGHFIVKEGRKEMKRWCVIFTCLYSRAIHIEVVNDLSTDTFMQALRRLENIRGPVSTIFSDHGTNFMGSKTHLEPRITFKTNPPTASHQGGVWERGIRTIRSVFNAMRGKYATRMDTEGLRTAMYEVCGIINNKPLTCTALDKPHEGVVTPSHLLTMKPYKVSSNLDNETTEADVYARSMYRRTQKFAEEFWHHWKDYLAKVETRKKWCNPLDNLKVGDIVAIVEESLPRGVWRLGTIECAHAGADGRVRSATVRVAEPDKMSSAGKRIGEPTMLERPVQKLILILSK